MNDFYDKRPVMRGHDSPTRIVSLMWDEVAELSQEVFFRDPIDKELAGEEIADVVVYCMLLSRELGIDMTHAVLSKIAKNDERFPVALFDGSTPGTFEEIYLARKRELGER